MIAIGDGWFVLDAPLLRDKELREYAKKLFAEFDESTSRLLPLDDFGLHLEIEQGSLKGKSAILATLGALYVGISTFGEFVHGVKEISSLAKIAVDEVNKLAAIELGLPPKAVTGKRGDAGELTQLNRLFEQVARGQLQPDEATERAMKLFAEEDEIPKGFALDLSRAVHNIKLHPKQLDLLPEAPEFRTPPPSEPRPRRSDSRDIAIADLRRRLRIEMHRAHKGGRTVVKVVTL